MTNIKIVVELELDRAEQQQILQNSIERVMNTAIELGDAAERGETSEHLKELGSTSWQDCEELKPITSKLWDMTRNAIFVKLQEIQK